MARRRLIAGNWKMNKTPAETESFLRFFLPLVAQNKEVEVVLLPPFTSLDRAGALLAETGVSLGGQDLSCEKGGAFTGEVSAGMLASCGCRYVLVGHSERRTLFHEDDSLVNRKLRAALDGALTPILCLGETLPERRRGETEKKVTSQLVTGLGGVEPRAVESLVIAYEPVWAIGTGEAASPQAAQETIAFLRRSIAAAFGKAAAEGVRLLYGGSVTPENIAPFLNEPDVDGALVGGASLSCGSLAAIVAAVR
jgi:triosephosphate isomerase